MTDALLDQIEAALQQATPGPWKRVRATAVLVGDGGGIPQTEGNAELIANAPAWLARLCARVRHLEAENAALHESNSRREIEITTYRRPSGFVKLEERAARAEAASQRLTEAATKILQMLDAKSPSEHLVPNGVEFIRKTLREVLGAGAPPEVGEAPRP